MPFRNLTASVIRKPESKAKLYKGKIAPRNVSLSQKPKRTYDLSFVRNPHVYANTHLRQIAPMQIQERACWLNPDPIEVEETPQANSQMPLLRTNQAFEKPNNVHRLSDRPGETLQIIHNLPHIMLPVQPSSPKPT